MSLLIKGKINYTLEQENCQLLHFLEMKREYFLFFICYLVCFTQCSFKASSEKSKTKKETLSKSSPDSVIVGINDTVELSPLNSKVNLIVVKEKSNDDYLKYIFPVFTLLLGIAINKGLDWLSDRKKTKKAGKRWVAEIRSLENPIANEIDFLGLF